MPHHPITQTGPAPIIGQVDPTDTYTNPYAGLRLDLAIRTSKRKTEARSPQQQTDMAYSSAQLNRYNIVMVHDSGADESGKTMDRATLRTVMERVERGETDGMIVALADRLGRAPIEEAMAYVRRLTGVGVLVLADMGGVPLNIDDPAAETGLVMQLQMARQYWLMTANRFARSQTDALKAGRFIGPTPLGYLRHADGPLKGILYPHPVDGPKITKAYKIAAVSGLHAAQTYLATELPERTDGERGARKINWTTSATRRTLRRKAYMGWSYSDGHDTNKKAHPALIDETTWKAAQTEPRGRASNGDYPLSHFLMCSHCDARLVGGIAVGRDGTRYRRMRCGACAKSSVYADKVEAFLAERMAVALADQPFRDQFAPEGLDGAQRELALATADVEAHNNMDPRLRRRMGAERWQDSLATLLDAEDAARDTYNKLLAQANMSEVLPLADQLHKPDQFHRALLAITSRVNIIVGPGRVPLAERIIFRPIDQGDDVARALKA